MSVKVVNDDVSQEPATDNPLWKMVIEILIGAVLVGVVFAVWLTLLAPLFRDMLP